MKVVAAILAAGKGERFGQDKTQVLLQGKPLWRWSFDVFHSHPRIQGVGLVGSASNLARMSGAPSLFLVEGGPDRRESSRIAVQATPSDADVVLLHDAARPYVSHRLITEVLEGVERAGAAAPGLPVTDTVKRIGPERLETIDRRGLYTVQTPQGARRDLLLAAHSSASVEVTDDLQLLEAIGIVPEIVPGDVRNVKITHESDLAESARRLTEVRTGMGYDVHAFSVDPERPLWLGGVQFEGERGLEGHSDADVVLHAAVDALLGAAGLGDIGVHFPNHDPLWKDRASIHFLKVAGGLLKENGWSVQNVDLTVVAEHPKLMARADEMRRQIAHALEIDSGRVNLKATTNERLGFIGRGEGIAALATATIARFEIGGPNGSSSS